MNTVSEIEGRVGEIATTKRPRASGVRAIAHSIISKAGILAINAATGILTARALQPTGRGELAAMIIWSLFLASATTLGVPSSLIFHLRRRSDLRRELTSTSMAMAFLLGTIAALAGAAFLPAWLHQYSPALISAARWFLIFTPICSMTLAGRAILEATDDFSVSNLVQTFTPLATLLALAGFLFAHRLTPYTAGIAYVFASIPTFLILLFRLNLRWMRPRYLRLDAAKLLLSYGIRSYGIDLLGTLALQVDQVLVVNLLSPGAMGSYVVVLSLSRMLNLFQNSVVMVLFPKAAGKTSEAVLELTEQSARLSTTITAFCGLLVCALGPFLLRLLYGREYVGAVNSLRVLVTEVTLSGLVFVLAQAFMALARPGIITFLQAIGLGLCLPVMYWLVPKWGVMGAAVALLVSTSTRLLLILLAFPFVLKTRLPRLFPHPNDFETVTRKLSTLNKSNVIKTSEPASRIAE
jgi:O-antigen/teichoic acid export membrane protein